MGKAKKKTDSNRDDTEKLKRENFQDKMRNKRLKSDYLHSAVLSCGYGFCKITLKTFFKVIKTLCGSVSLQNKQSRYMVCLDYIEGLLNSV